MRLTGAVLAVFTGCALAQQPASKGINFFSLDREIDLGRRTAAAVAGARLADPVLNTYVSKLGAAIAKSADPRFTYTFAFYDDHELFVANGPLWPVPPQSEASEPMTIAGGFVFVPLSLLADASSEAEFAFQLAHAVAHISLRHATRAMTRAELIQISLVPLQDTADSGVARAAVRQGAGLAIPMAAMTMARMFEREADFTAVQWTAAAGYDPLAIVPRLESQSPPERPTVFQSHPTPASRAAAIVKAANALPPASYNAGTGEFAGMKALASRR